MTSEDRKPVGGWHVARRKPTLCFVCHEKKPSILASKRRGKTYRLCCDCAIKLIKRYAEWSLGRGIDTNEAS